jgi:hypothetical protein
LVWTSRVARAMRRHSSACLRNSVMMSMGLPCQVDRWSLNARHPVGFPTRVARRRKSAAAGRRAGRAPQVFAAEIIEHFPHADRQSKKIANSAARIRNHCAGSAFGV